VLERTIVTVYGARVAMGDGDVGTTEPALAVADQPEPPPSDPDAIHDPLHAPFLWTTAGLVIAALWIRPMLSSLWVDELGTWWVISGSAREAASRAEAVQGQSPVYYLIEWAMRHVLGRSEFGLRVPSLIFSLAAAVLIYRIAKRLIDAEAARIAIIAFAVWPSVAFAASDARPYALATLTVVAATWAIIGWLDSGRLGAAALFVLLATSIPYVHPLFGLVLIPLALYALARIREGTTSVRARALVLALIAVGLLAIPIALELFALWRRHEDWSVPNAVTVSWVMQTLAPPAFVGAAVVGGFLAVAKLKITSGSRRLPKATAILLIGWLLIPPAILVGLSVMSPVALLEGRYFLSAAPAGALLAAAAIRALEPAQTRRIVVLALVILSVLDLAAPVKSGDMRGAAALVRSVADERSVVFIPSGFQESLQRSWYTDPERQGLLTAATSFYPVPGQVVPLPGALDGATIDFARAQVGDSIARTDKVITVTLTGSSYGPWFDEYMRQQGWTGSFVGEVNQFTVIEYTRDD
jgi:mannosyltransferase